MKLTKSQLRKLIKEEMKGVFSEREGSKVYLVYKQERDDNDMFGGYPIEGFLDKEAAIKRSKDLNDEQYRHSVEDFPLLG